MCAARANEAVGPTHNRPLANDLRGHPETNDDIMVIGYEIHGDARAYPAALLDEHELVNDLIGGKRTLKIGDLFGTVIVPFMKVESDEDYERLVEIAEETIDFFAENALEHERIGEMIERIGLVNFLEGIGLEVDPNMIAHPRESSYVRTDGWDAEVEKWFARNARNSGAAH